MGGHFGNPLVCPSLPVLIPHSIDRLLVVALAHCLHLLCCAVVWGLMSTCLNHLTNKWSVHFWGSKSIYSPTTKLVISCKLWVAVLFVGWELGLLSLLSSHEKCDVLSLSCCGLLSDSSILPKPVTSWRLTIIVTGASDTNWQSE